MSKVAKEMKVLAETAGFQKVDSVNLSTSFVNKSNGDNLTIRFSDGYFSYTNGDTYSYGAAKGVAALARVLIERLKGVR